MLGYAEFKSHVGRRDEKGVFGIPFKRLLGCGLGAGALHTGARMVVPEGAFVVAAVCFVALLVMTAPQGGIARWKHLVYAVRWGLRIAAALMPGSGWGRAARAMGIQGKGIDIDTEVLFRGDEGDGPRTVLADWVTFSGPLGMGDLMAFSTAPMIQSKEGVS